MEQLLAQYGMDMQYRGYLYAAQPIDWWDSEQLTQIAIYTGIYEKIQYREIRIFFVNGDTETLALGVIFLDDYLRTANLSTDVAKKQFQDIHLTYNDKWDIYESDSYQDSKNMLQFLLSLLSETTLCQTIELDRMQYQASSANEELQSLLDDIERNNCINDPDRLDDFMRITIICQPFEAFIDLYRDLQQTSLSTPIVNTLKACVPDFLYQMLSCAMEDNLCSDMPDDAAMQCLFNEMVGAQQLNSTVQHIFEQLEVNNYQQMFDKFSDGDLEVLLSDYSFTQRQ